MFIRYLGHACFFISGAQKVVIDPHDQIGYQMEKVSCDYCLTSHDHFDHNAVENVDAGLVVDCIEAIKACGGVELEAFEAFHDDALGEKRGKTFIFSFVIDGVRFTHLGDLGEDFSQSIVDKIGKTDVLFLPVGGTYTIDAKEALKYADAIGAKITVPMHFKTPRSTVDVDRVDAYKALIRDFKEVDGDYNLTSQDLPEERLTLIFDDSRF